MMMRAAVVGLLLGLWASSALAQSRVVVLSFDGPGAARVRAAVVEALGEDHGIEVVKEKDATRAAKTLGVDLSTDPGRVALAKQLSISAYVDGSVSKHGSSSQVSVRVYNGRDGALLGETKVTAGRDAIARRVKKIMMPDLGAALAQAKPPAVQHEPEPEPPPVEKPQPRQEPPPEQAQAEPEAEPEPEQGASPQTALELGANVRVLTRSYSYTDALLRLGVHSLDPTPALRLEARWYPAAHFTRGFASNLGLDLHGQMMWPVDATKGSASFKTTSFVFGIAARLRIPVAEHQLGVFVGYGGQSLALADSKGQDPGVPSVAYGFVRLGGDARFALPAGFSIGLHVAYLLLTGFGELGQAAWFSHVGGGGIEAELSLGYELSPLVVLNAGGGLTRYFMSLKPEPNDVGAKDHGRVAGGLADQYPFGMVGVTLRP